AFENSDKRNARFVVTPRQTNERWAIDLIKEVPPKGVVACVVACDGGPGALGHPRVYINLVSFFWIYL
ncbi:NADH dehydrogenase Fe-S protein subunit 6 ndufs6, partial [Halocaridina rubra]